jgi:hypothetical protein
VKSRAVYFVTVIAGLICGVLSTIPFRLRFLPSLFLWGGVGVLIGLFARKQRFAIRLGLLYAIFLLIGFFLAQIAADTKAIHSPIFIGLAIVLTPIGAVLAVCAGSMVRHLARNKTR